MKKKIIFKGPKKFSKILNRDNKWNKKKFSKIKKSKLYLREFKFR